jgi:hypothetical protein
MLIPENSLFTPSAMLSGRPSWNCFFLKDGSEPVDNAAAKSEVLTAHIQEQLMSHMGQTRTFRHLRIKSALPRKADIARCGHEVRLVPMHEVAALQPAARGARVERSVSSREDVSQHRLSNATLRSHSAGSARSRGEVRGDVPAN